MGVGLRVVREDGAAAEGFRGEVYFFGTGFTLKTKDFKRWERVQRNRMADPGVAISNGKLHVLSVGM